MGSRQVSSRADVDPLAAKFSKEHIRVGRIGKTERGDHSMHPDSNQLIMLPAVTEVMHVAQLVVRQREIKIAT